MKRIGMIGLGVMGSGIAQNMIDHGILPVVYDLRAEAMTPFVKQGAQGAESLQDFGTKVDAAFMIVNSYKHCVSVLTDLLQTMHSGVIVNMSTIALDDAKALEKMANEKGVKMIDCPVSGGTRGAAAGELTLMAAGEDEWYNELLPVFQSFGKNVVHVGKEVGQGQAVKAINQLLVGVHMCATAEAFTLARQCGLDLQLVYDTIKTSAGCSNIFANRGQFLIDRDFSIRSTLQIQLKDTNIACEAANSVGAPAPLANVARELFKLAVRKYPPNDDSLEVVRIYEELCGLNLE